MLRIKIFYFFLHIIIYYTKNSIDFTTYPHRFVFYFFAFFLFSIWSIYFHTVRKKNRILTHHLSIHIVDADTSSSDAGWYLRLNFAFLFFAFYEIIILSPRWRCFFGVPMWELQQQYNTCNVCVCSTTVGWWMITHVIDTRFRIFPKFLCRLTRWLRF